MTEAEWMGCGDLLKRLAHVSEAASDRKLRLYGCACCQRIEALLTDERSRRAVEVAERFADSQAGNGNLETARVESFEAIRFVSGRSYGSSYERRVAKGAAEAAAKLSGKKINKVIVAVIAAALDSLAEAAGLVGARLGSYATHRHTQWHASVEQFTVLLTDIFGNPFRLAEFSSEWRTDTAVLLARQMYESREFGAIPILADALQDAGCDSEDILSHCRGPGLHVRGCWVVDLVLGKE
jgi:hypothetical protein